NQVGSRWLRPRSRSGSGGAICSILSRLGAAPAYNVSGVLERGLAPFNLETKCRDIRPQICLTSSRRERPIRTSLLWRPETPLRLPMANYSNAPRGRPMCWLRSVESLGVKGDGTFAAAIDAAPAEFETTPRASDDLAAILYTSGTTGRSKGAMLTHENLSSNALTLIDLWRFGPADRLIHALPVFHTHGLFVAVNVALLSGATMIFMPRFDPEAVIAALPEATAMMGVPTFYTRLLDHPGLDRDICANMRLFVSGSAPLLAETHSAWRERTGFAILERYGMTETNMIASNPYDSERRPGSVGFALPEVSVRIADLESGAPVQAGKIGVIEVKGRNVFAGYWRMPEKTSQEFRADGYFITGDLANVDDDGYIHIAGRAKDLVISGGFNVYPKEVETEIDAIEGVLESAVFGVPHADFGEAVTAAVVMRPGAALNELAILTALGRRLAKFKAPKQIVLVDSLPRNAMGKVQKAALRDAYRDIYRRP